jgi:hypothetical protein
MGGYCEATVEKLAFASQTAQTILLTKGALGLESHLLKGVISWRV